MRQLFRVVGMAVSAVSGERAIASIGSIELKL
jgi:hypothetical protein